jgi:uncharacterized protein YggT (Ycf19 family)
MSPTESFWTHWYFHVPNLVLAALFYTLIGRYLLGLVFASRPDVVILKVFQSVTDPVVKLVRFVTPAIVPDGLVILFAAVWLIALRMFLFLTIFAAGASRVA